MVSSPSRQVVDNLQNLETHVDIGGGLSSKDKGPASNDFFPLKMTATNVTTSAAEAILKPGKTVQKVRSWPKHRFQVVLQQLAERGGPKRGGSNSPKWWFYTQSVFQLSVEHQIGELKELIGSERLQAEQWFTPGRRA